MTSALADVPNRRSGYRTEIEFLIGSFPNRQHRTEGKRHQQRLLTISTHLPLWGFHIWYIPRVLGPNERIQEKRRRSPVTEKFPIDGGKCERLIPALRVLPFPPSVDGKKKRKCVIEVRGTYKRGTALTRKAVKGTLFGARETGSDKRKQSQAIAGSLSNRRWRSGEFVFRARGFGERRNQVVNLSYTLTVGNRAPPTEFGTCVPDWWSLALES